LEGGIGFKNSILLSISSLQLRRKEVKQKGKGGEGTYHQGSVFVNCVSAKPISSSNTNTNHQHKKIEEEKI
jgi:hypothetical protein